MNCPHCKTPTVIKKAYEGVEIDHCKTCFGAWLDQNELNLIVANRTIKFSPEQIRESVSAAFAGVPPSELKKDKRHCPHCNGQLNTLNYAYDSGIMIDVCPNEHGMWLDNQELENIQQYREYWQDKSEENLESLTKLIENVESSPTEKTFHSLLFSLASEVTEIIGKIKKS